MKIENNWELIKKIFENGHSSFHCSVATVNQDGTPNVIPIGSLFLRDNFTGFFFDTNLNTTAKNFQLNKKEMKRTTPFTRHWPDDAAL